MLNKRMKFYAKIRSRFRQISEKPCINFSLPSQPTQLDDAVVSSSKNKKTMLPAGDFDLFGNKIYAAHINVRLLIKFLLSCSFLESVNTTQVKVAQKVYF